MLIDVRDCEKPINGFSNGGVMTTREEEDLPGLFTVYYNPESLMNKVLLSDTRKRFKVTMDTSAEVAILVHINDKRVMRFLEIGAGLYIWKTETNTNLLNKHIYSYSFLSLVSTNKSSYTRHELVRIDAAKKLYINLGMLGYKKDFSSSGEKFIRDCPLMSDDDKRCLSIYGK